MFSNIFYNGEEFSKRPDGIYLGENYDGNKTYVVMKSKSDIKSAVGNNGLYDVKKTNIQQSKEEDAPKGISVGLTPFAGNRIPKYEQLHREMELANESGNEKEVNRIKSEMAADLDTRLKRIVPDADIKITPSDGLWKGDSEPTFYVEMNEVNDDNLAALAKVAHEFDQDEVHIRDNSNVDHNIPFLEVQSDGSYNTHSVIIEFDGKHDFAEVAKKHGFDGATVIGKNSLLLYNTELPTKERSTNTILEEFDNKVKSLIDDNRGSIKETSGTVTRLRRYSRDGREEGTTSYEQALSNLHPKEETRRRLEGNHEETKLGVWANSRRRQKF